MHVMTGLNPRPSLELHGDLDRVTFPTLHFLRTRAQHFPLNCTHTQTMPISNDLCPPMPTISMTCAHPCPPMLFKLRPCIQKLCNVYYPPTPSLGWIGQIKGRSLSLASARSASWLAYSMHPRSLTPIWSWMQGIFLSFGILLA